MQTHFKIITSHFLKNCIYLNSSIYYFNTVFVEFETNNQYGKNTFLTEWMVSLFVFVSEETGYVSQIY